MKRFIIVLVVVMLASFPALGQSRFPSPGGTFAGLPASGAKIRVYTVTDCIDAACAAGGGSAAWMQKNWNGSAWVNVGGMTALSVTQTTPTQVEYQQLQMNVLDPATFPMSIGIQMATAGENLVPDHIIGIGYNMDGPGGITQNKFRHAFVDRYETEYRHDPNTASESWVEHNIDLSPPDNSGVLENFSDETAFESATFAGRSLTFSGGGTADIVAYTAGTNTLEFRMTNATAPSTTDTVTIQAGFPSAPETADFDGEDFVYLGSSGGHAFRPYQSVWKVKENTFLFSFDTHADTATPATLRLNNGSVGINWTGQVGAASGQGTMLNVAGPLGISNNPAAYFITNTDGTDGGDTTMATIGLTLQLDYRGEDWNYQNSGALRIAAPFLPLGTNSSLQTHTAIIIEDQNMPLSTSSSEVIRIQRQGCNGVASSCANANHGNLTFRGGEWNNGHITFQNAGAGGHHLWFDRTDDALRLKVDNGPVSESDGNALLTENSSLDFLTSGSLRGQVDVVATTATTDTPTTDEMRGSFHTASNVGVVTYTLPEISTIGIGASACFYDLDATAILTIDVDAADVIVLNGVDLDAGDTIDSPGARGDFICLLAIDNTNWLVLGRSGVWVDGGP
jgi:hypothetical protein